MSDRVDMLKEYNDMSENSDNLDLQKSSEESEDFEED
jgi:hypothetical protein